MTYVIPCRNYRLWLPTDLSNLRAWYDSVDLTTQTIDTGSGNRVTQWRDKSGNGFHMGNTGFNRPSSLNRNINGQNAIDFDGSNDTFFTNNQIASQPFNMHTVLDLDSVTTRDSITYGNNNAGNFEIDVSFNGLVQFNGVTLYTGSIGFGAGQPSLVGCAGNSFGSQNYSRGNVLGTGDTGTNSWGSGGSPVCWLGSQGGTGQYINGGMGDFICWQGTSTTERQLVEGFLAWKFGLASQLPSSHPYKSGPPIVYQ